MQAPLALPDDGLLDLVLFRKLSPHALVRGLAGAWMRRGVPTDVAHRVRSARFRLSSSTPLPFQVDGEVCLPSPIAECSVIRAGLRLVAP